mgnify:FL=1
MNLMKIASAVSGHVMGGDVVFDQVTTDTRVLSGGELFVALAGDHYDGHDFIDEAKRSGAVAAMTSRPVETDLPTLVVADTRRSLGQLASYWRGQFDIPMIAVTGSNGKTTVKEMMASILRGLGPTLSNAGNLNNEIGLPLTLLRMSEDHEYAVVEMGMNHAGEIRKLTRIALPSVVVVLNAAPAHLEGLADITGVARAKAEIFAGLNDDGLAIINADDRFAVYWRARARHHRTLTFGLDRSADVTADVSVDREMLELLIRLPNDSIEVKLNLLGRHNAANALAAATAAWSMGCTPEQIRCGLGNVQPIKGRLEPRRGAAGSSLIDDTYNANPVSLDVAIQCLAPRMGKRIIVLGDMAELGSRSRDLHSAAGEMIRHAGIDQLLTMGDMAKNASDAFGLGASHFDSHEAVIDATRDLLGADVTCLVKGSRSAEMENVADALTETGG